MQQFCSDVRTFLSTQGHVLLREVVPPHAVEVRPHGSVLIASMDFEGGRRSVVLKRIHPGAHMTAPERLIQAHNAIRERSPALCRSLPSILGHDPDEKWIILEHVPGPTLLE